MDKTLGSDTMAPAFPEVIEAIAAANTGEADSYGVDSYTETAKSMFRDLFGAPVEVRWSLGGTGANVLALACVLNAGQSVITPATAHMIQHESGAVSRATGAQLTAMPATDGKLQPVELRSTLATTHDHQSLPVVVSISQSTEFGTVYEVDEVAAIADIAHAYNALLHVDGARIANALVSTRATVKEMLTDTGVDLISFGATKGGTAFGEAVVFVKPHLAEGTKRTHISVGQLSAKTRFIAAQFIAYLADDRWLRGADNANAMAQLLAKELANIGGLRVDPVQTNMVWAHVPPGMVTALEKASYYMHDNHTRWVTAWDTTEADVRQLADRIAALAG